ncbi:MAG: tetratricopeptide repeat protein [Longimicrobiales bacterium]
MTDASPARSTTGPGTRTEHRDEERQPARVQAWLAAASVAIASLLTYANTLANRFAVDDDFIIRNNPRIQDLSDQASIWLTPYWPGQDLGLYRPVAMFTYALEWAAGGGAPWVFHLGSVLLHATAAILLLFLLRRLVSNGGALAGALLFGVHPVHTEAVANVVGQAELLAAIAVFGACLTFASRGQGVRLSPRRAVVIAVLFAAGLLAKEGAIVLPGLLVALDLAQQRLRLERASATAWLRAVAVPMTLLLVVGIAWLALRLHVLGSLGGGDAAPWLPFLHSSARIPTALEVWPEYARLLFFPVDLSADYSPAVLMPAESIDAAVVFGALLLLVALVLALVTPVRPAAGLPAAWFVIAILPVSNLIVPIGVLLAERTLYLPSVAVSLAAAFAWAPAVARLPRRWRRPAFALAAAVLVLLAARSFVRNPDWRDSNAYYAALLRDHPENYRAQWGLAAAHLAVRDLAGARAPMELARRLWPNDAQQLTELALLYIWNREYAGAVTLLEEARALSDVLPRTWNSLAWASLGARRWTTALEAADGAERRGMASTEAAAVRAQAYEGLGRLTDARHEWRKSLTDSAGGSWTYWSANARLLARLGDRAAALAAADSARTLAPDSSAPVVDSLLAAIARGCFAPARPGPASSAESPETNQPRKPAPETCSDPLATWWVVTSSRPLAAPADDAHSP